MSAQLFNKTFAVRCGSGIRLPATKAQSVIQIGFGLHGQQKEQSGTSTSLHQLCWQRVLWKVERNRTEHNITLKSVIFKTIAEDILRIQVIISKEESY